MGDCKSSMVPTTPAKAAPPSTSSLKSALGVFKKKVKDVLPPPKKNFADYVNAAFDELEKSIKNTSRPNGAFGEQIDGATTALLRLIDIKEHELIKEKGREDYNQLALSRLVEISRLLEHASFVFGELSTQEDVMLPLKVLNRLLEHIGEIGAEYAETN